jgi:alpha,alpha-trehalose-phosphate synthase [UDP-forming]
VRRLAALAITIALAWLVVLKFGTGSSGATAFALGLALIAASIVGWLFSFLRLPRITGYLAFGLLCGPAVANLMTGDMARDLRAASGFAIALVSFIAGLQLPVKATQPPFGRLAVFSVSTMLLAWIGIAASLFAAWPWLPIAPELADAERLAAAALAAVVLVSVSPTVTVAVIAEARASGSLASLATGTVVVAQVLVIGLFAVCLEATRLVFGTLPAGPGATLAAVMWTVVGSLAFGGLFGALFVLYVRWIGREITLALLGLCAIIAGLGAQIGLEPLVAGIAAGLVFQLARADARTVLLDAVRDGATPVVVLLFTALGASMNVAAVADAYLVALAVAAVRFLWIRFGAAAGARVARLTAQESRRLWIALIPTSGITLSFAVLVAREYPQWGPPFLTVVVATVAFYEVISPILLRASLSDASEIGVPTGGLVVVSNREPWIHDFTPDGAIAVRHATGGVSVALDAMMRERGGVWVAHGSGTADHAVTDPRDSVDVPPGAPAYRLRRLWLSHTEVEGYYSGFSNSALWPLCHQAHIRPQFRAEDWEAYQAVNQKFADVVAEEAPQDSSVFLNDYHLTLVAGYLRKRRPHLRTALFWHIPWPDVDRLRICPWRKELVEGLLANDLLAFQVDRDQRNFLAAAQEEVGVSVRGEFAFFGDRRVRVVSIPIGADFDRISTIVTSGELPARIDKLERELNLQGKAVGVGVDRLDYTKGIPERLRAIEQALERLPDVAPHFTFVQIGVPSRADVPGYAEISAEIDVEVGRINHRFGRGPADGPIRYVKQSFELPDLVALYRRARFCIVSSLHDGMNLVAKEFVASREDMDGVLILSELAGAANELHEALIINPYDERGFADAIVRAIEMPPWERRRRMQALHRRAAGRDVLAWASSILDRLERRKGPGFLAG